MTALRGLRPQGVDSGWFNSSVSRWVLISLLVLILFVSHAVSEVAKEVHMNKSQLGSLSMSRVFLSSTNTTMWAIGTSAVAGALST